MHIKVQLLTVNENFAIAMEPVHFKQVLLLSKWFQKSSAVYASNCFCMWERLRKDYFPMGRYLFTYVFKWVKRMGIPCGSNHSMSDYDDNDKWMRRRSLYTLTQSFSMSRTHSVFHCLRLSLYLPINMCVYLCRSIFDIDCL